jgi:predicted negative regulator of RcsB-dependent stress response
LAHISRRELKKDEVRDTFAHGAEAVLSHQKLSIYILVVAVAIAIGVFGWKAYDQRQTLKAAAAFDDAMKVYQAPVQGNGEAAPPGVLTYKDEKVKFGDASKKFADIAAKYSRTRPAQLALYFQALSLEKLGQNDEAKKLLQALVARGGDDFSSVGQFELAQLEDRTGQPAEALKLYQQLLAKPSVLVSKPVVMLSLAEHYGNSNPSEAAKMYQQIKSEYPDSAMAQQADQELGLLPKS